MKGEGRGSVAEELNSENIEREEEREPPRETRVRQHCIGKEEMVFWVTYRIKTLLKARGKWFFTVNEI